MSKNFKNDAELMAYLTTKNFRLKALLKRSLPYLKILKPKDIGLSLKDLILDIENVLLKDGDL